MIHNDVLRSVRYMLSLNDVGIAALFELGGKNVPLRHVAAFMLREDEEGYLACTDAEMAAFLDGLVVKQRGPSPDGSKPPLERRVTNNTVLKKLRVAFELRDESIAEMMQAVGMPVSKPELSALFRNPSHANFRACGDQFLRNFLKALTVRVRGAA